MPTKNPDNYVDELYGQLSSGLPDDFHGTLTNCRFGVPMGQVDNPRMALIADIVTDDPDLGNGGTLEEQAFGLGAGWKKIGKGESVEREDGKKAAFNTNSKIGRLTKSLLDQESFKDALMAREARPALVDASFWEGITGHFRRIEASFKDKDTGEKLEYNYFVIDEFDGFKDSGSGSSGKAAPAKAAAKAAKAPAKKAAKVPAKAKGDDTLAEAEVPEVEEKASQIYAIAMEVIESGDERGHDAFMERALEEVDGADSDEFLTDLIADPDKVWNTAVEAYEAG